MNTNASHQQLYEFTYVVLVIVSSDTNILGRTGSCCFSLSLSIYLGSTTWMSTWTTFTYPAVFSWLSPFAFGSPLRCVIALRRGSTFALSDHVNELVADALTFTNEGR